MFPRSDSETPFGAEPRHNGHRRTSEFVGASVVQLIAGQADEPGALVAALQPARVTIDADRVTAIDGDMEWSWLVDEIEAVVHAVDETWTIFIVPGISDFGIEVDEGDVARFRAALAALPDVSIRHQSPATVAQPLVLDVPPTERSPSSFEPPRPGRTERRSSAQSPTDVEDALRPIESELLIQPLDVGTSTPVPDDIVHEAADETIELPTIAVAPVTVAPDAPAPVATVATAGVGVAIPIEDARDPRTWRARVKQRSSAASHESEPRGLAGLDARHISAWFGARQVLDRVSLEMPAGQVTALIGPSGCGKSTFLRILNRMHEMIPSAAMAGEVMLDGHDIYDPSRKLTDARREIGMVFQKPNPFPAMSIYDNVVASLQLTGRKVGQDVKDDLVESCLSKAGLWNEVKDRLRQPGGGLSGGQQQRLCIARALAIRPRVLLMDEPCSALDPTSTRRIEQTIKELVSEVTIVIVTHNMQQAARVSNRCAFFLAEHGTPGAIVEHGPTAAMFGSPQDQRTDDYVNGRFG